MGSTTDRINISSSAATLLPPTAGVEASSSNAARTSINKAAEPVAATATKGSSSRWASPTVACFTRYDGRHGDAAGGQAAAGGAAGGHKLSGSVQSMTGLSSTGEKTAAKKTGRDGDEAEEQEGGGLGTGVLGGSAGAATASSSHRKGMLGGRPVGKLGDSTLFGSAELCRSFDLRPMSQKYAQQYEKVKQLLLRRGDLTKSVINANAEAYYNHLGLNEYYFQTASPQTVASNLACVIAAKMLNEMSHSDYFPKIVQEREGEVFLLARASLRNRKASQNYQVEREIEKKFLNLHAERGEVSYRMQCYRSTGSFFDDPADETERLRTYFLQQPEYASSVEAVDKNETDLSKLLDVYFFANKQHTATAEIYSRLNEDVVRDSTEQALFVNVVPRGTGYRMDFAFRRGPHTKDFFSRVGDSVTMWGFYSQRKYVEPLANGVCLMTTFIEELPEDQLKEFPVMSIGRRVEQLVKSIRMQYILKPSRFTELAQERLLTVHEAAYARAATKFIQHFSGTVGPVFGSVEKMVKNFGAASQLSQQELYELRTRLKVPPFSEDTLIKTVVEHVDIVKLLYQEFEALLHPHSTSGLDQSNPHTLNNSVSSSGGGGGVEPSLASRPAFVEESALKRKILCLESPEASAILLKFRVFNSNILRTNFWRSVKQALAFRMHPGFLPLADYSDTPYAILFIVASHYIGFHVRFAAVARGGVRVVQSFTSQSYQRNRDAAFDEVYSLANTQNLKNKDIAESGSKGVVLLDRTVSREEADQLTKVAFKSYIDSMLDVLLPDASVVDRLMGAEEVCFLGPDEHTGTGLLMDWAAERARERGAWFWRAFTTGKQPRMGGIPHDVYGMTTASIETYIRGVMSKLASSSSTTKASESSDSLRGKKTRFLVGGPDGDLGSNALLRCAAAAASVGAAEAALKKKNSHHHQQQQQHPNKTKKGGAQAIEQSTNSGGGIEQSTTSCTSTPAAAKAEAAAVEEQVEETERGGARGAAEEKEKEDSAEENGDVVVGSCCSVITSVVDGSGVLHDPQGLDHRELRRLALRRFQGLPTCSMLYDERLLSPQGFKVSQDARGVKLPDGSVISSGFHFRNDFHLNSLASADLFNPCGGRPASITPFNVEKMFDAKTGQPRFKVIVEGANVFITDEARRMLEDRGVILFKDASTNKGGVTSSSFEVLAALALTDEEFAVHMRVTGSAVGGESNTTGSCGMKGKGSPPPFYCAYVREVMRKIRENAWLEFNALWTESLRTGRPRCDLTDVLSEKILRLKKDISSSDTLWKDQQLVSRVLHLALPNVLVPGLMNIETLKKRVPESYLQAIFRSFLASRFYYSQQFTDDLSAFAFFDYIQQIKRGDVGAAARAAAAAAAAAEAAIGDDDAAAAIEEASAA